ncbi:hypothetical protein AMOR_21800 [Anaeromyxobacter oryzae]|uniref:Serine aminopeptidase S33 domain-containing protein n=1 Tax=Anaeromyxobacter oryzae TaxID=2918170 RepID=A0ABM7WUQ1_9BACT|nr:hypothetical protein AMOR_21800 [Anaeromyxobacter oryzae]
MLAGTFLFAALLLAALFLLQRRLLYFPDRMSEDDAVRAASHAGAVPWRDDAGRLRGWRLARPPRDPRAVALVLHGNAGSALDRLHYARALSPRGVDVAILEYPGYGARPGAPALASLEAAAIEAVDALAREGRPVWLVGESLGSGVAGRTAAARPDAVRGLVLVTPYADLAAVARLHYPIVPPWLLRDRFRPARDLAAFRGPAVVLVAGADEVVGPAEGRRLFAALPGPKRLVEQPGATHNGIDLASPALWDEVVAFLDHGGG